MTTTKTHLKTHLLNGNAAFCGIPNPGNFTISISMMSCLRCAGALGKADRNGAISARTDFNGVIQPEIELTADQLEILAEEASMG